MSTLESQEDMMSDAQLALERRNARDRRNPTFKGFLIGCIKCRRRGPRRAESYLYFQTDWYDVKLLVMALGLLLLSCIDAALTMYLLDRGATEANPLMNYLLTKGIHTFVYTKVAMTAICIIVLVMHYHSRIFNWLRVDVLLLFALFIYSGVVTYELSAIVTINNLETTISNATLVQ